MKIFSAGQIRKWDAFTIAHEPISSLELMERAATACYKWLSGNIDSSGRYAIFCGPGNNGGDGLAIARMLLRAGNTVSIYIFAADKRSDDFSNNLESLAPLTQSIQFINDMDLPVLPAGSIVIDALWGSGLNRPLQGLAAEIIHYVNEASSTVVSIDIPSGLFADTSSEGNAIVRSSHTLSFQTPKLAFFLPANKKYTGSVHLLDIGLHADFYNTEPSKFNTIEEKEIQAVYRPREQSLHKYNFGHALLYAGSKNMMGAGILCAKACLRAGAGVVTLFAETDTRPIVQIALPEAITSTEKNLEKIWQKKSAIGIGPGIEPSAANSELLLKLIRSYTEALVIDASALQILSSDVELVKKKTGQPAILTPHTGEFEKLFGKISGDLEKIKLALQKAAELGCYIILKGHHTLIACPDGNAFFNTTGNAGMATAGSGDVLTGMLTGLLAQGYSQRDACILGVFLHGLAGNITAGRMSQEAMIAGDIIENIGEAYKKISRH